ncbi:hypothetical protein DRP07_00240 [Archaeoglobales archaeon]|nr:MAG: hypothetical protein DRP07_00240 [Archaeoglobales archaeon]
MTYRKDPWRGIVIGTICYLLLIVLMDREEFISFILDTVMGILLTSFFVVPIIRIILTGRFEIAEKTCFALGFILLIVYYYYFNVDVVILLLQWLLIYTLISLVINQFITKLEEMTP